MTKQRRPATDADLSVLRMAHEGQVFDTADIFSLIARIDAERAAREIADRQVCRQSKERLRDRKRIAELEAALVDLKGGDGC